MKLKDIHPKMEQTLFTARYYTVGLDSIPLIPKFIFKNLDDKGYQCCCLPYDLEGIDFIRQMDDNKTVNAWAVIGNEVIEIPNEEMNLEIEKITRLFHIHRSIESNDNYLKDLKQALESTGLSDETTKILKQKLYIHLLQEETIENSEFVRSYLNYCKIVSNARNSRLKCALIGYSQFIQMLEEANKEHNEKQDIPSIEILAEQHPTSVGIKTWFKRFLSRKNNKTIQ